MAWGRIPLLLALASIAQTAASAPPGADAVPGEVLLAFESNVGPTDRSEILDTLDALEHIPLGRTGVWRIRLEALTIAEAIDRLAGQPGVRYVEPNFVVTADAVTASTPADPLFAQQWALQNTGQTGGTIGADIHAVDAWDFVTGSEDVVVAVLDSGIEATHPDLAGNLYVNPAEIPGNGLDDDGNGYVDDTCGWDFVDDDNQAQDDNGHGTFVSGIIGAVGNNGLGISGVCWSVRLLPLKFLDANGSGTTADAVLALDYATSIGAHVTTNAWHGGPFSQALLDAIVVADQAGVAFVASAGADSRDLDVDPLYPASYDVPNVVAVAATDHDDLLVPSSNWGPSTVDLGAPGANILTTYPGASYRIIGGTSTATAHVAGAVALVLARFPYLLATSAASHLLEHAEALPSLAGLVRTGGRLDAYVPLKQVPSAAGPAIGSPQTLTLRWMSDAGPGVRMRLGLAHEQSELMLNIFDLRGRLVRAMPLGPAAAGVLYHRWDGEDQRGRPAARGAYLAQLRAGDAVATGHIVLPR